MRGSRDPRLRIGVSTLQPFDWRPTQQVPAPPAAAAAAGPLAPPPPAKASAAKSSSTGILRPALLRTSLRQALPYRAESPAKPGEPRRLLRPPLAPLLALLVAFSAVQAPAAERRTATIAGNGKAGYAPDQINNPYGLVTGPDGALYICEIGNHVIRRLDLKTGALTTVAGNARKGYSGDNGPATEASLNEPYEIRFDKAGDMFFVEMQNHIVRKVSRKTGIITTVAGAGKPGFSGDGGPAVKAELRQPHSIVFDRKGRLLICDIGNHRIRRVDLRSGLIETWAGTGERKPTPDGASVAGTPLNGPRALDVDSAGNLYLALREGNAIYRIDARTERLTRIAGTGEKGYSGDGGPALAAKLNGPKGVAWAKPGVLYIADTENHVIREIDLKSGAISTAAGSGARGDGPDGDPKSCKMNRPHGVFADRAGVVYVGDSEAHRVRRLR